MLSIEYDQNVNKLILSFDENGLNELIDEFYYKKNYFDHIELMVATGDLTENLLFESNKLITWFQINHIKNENKLTHMLSFEVKSSNLICCIDNNGIDLLLEALNALKKSSNKEVLLVKNKDLSPAYMPESDYKEVDTVKLQQISE